MSEYTDRDNSEHYASVPTLSWGDLRPGSFLHWDEKNEYQRKTFFSGANSIVEGLEKILDQYPNVLMLRGTSLEKLTNPAFFSVGDIETALLYSKRDEQFQPQHYPIILYVSLMQILPLMRKGDIESTYPWEVDKNNLINSGYMSLRFLNPSSYKAFTMRTPNYSKIPKNLLATI